MRYPNLRAEMARNSVTVRQLAEFLHVRPATISDKINGRSKFYCEEAFEIKKRFFPSCTFEYLFDQEIKSSA